MNREILFRGKCVSDSKYAGEWVTGGYVAPDADCKKRNEGLIVEYFGGNTTITYHVDPDTVGQFTGLVDKNGVKVFEGDIVRTNGCEEFFEVIYDAPDFCLKKNSSGYRFLNHPENFEVIGNIYDNQELLSTK